MTERLQMITQAPETRILQSFTHCRSPGVGVRGVTLVKERDRSNMKVKDGGGKSKLHRRLFEREILSWWITQYQPDSALKTGLYTFFFLSCPSYFLSTLKEETSARSTKHPQGVIRNHETSKHGFFLVLFSLSLFLSSATLPCTVSFSTGIYLLILALVSKTELLCVSFAFIEHCENSAWNSQISVCLKYLNGRSSDWQQLFKPWFNWLMEEAILCIC